MVQFLLLLCSVLCFLCVKFHLLVNLKKKMAIPKVKHKIYMKLAKKTVAKYESDL